MWLCLNDSFLSVVQHRDDSNLYLVRARRFHDIKKYFPEGEIIELDNADYRFRVIITREKLNSFMLSLPDNIEYPNFKRSVSDPELSRLYHKVWGEWYGINR